MFYFLVYSPFIYPCFLQTEWLVKNLKWLKFSIYLLIITEDIDKYHKEKLNNIHKSKAKQIRFTYLVYQHVNYHHYLEEWTKLLKNSSENYLNNSINFWKVLCTYKTVLSSLEPHTFSTIRERVISDAVG